MIRTYARTWVMVGIWLGALLMLIGASFLVSFVQQVDWKLCASLSKGMFFVLVLLLVVLLGQRVKRGI